MGKKQELIYSGDNICVRFHDLAAVEQQEIQSWHHYLQSTNGKFTVE